MDPLGIYIHIPYCIKKCRYCDFVSFEKAPRDEYFEGLALDIGRAGKVLAETEKSAGNAGFKPSADTVFFGGGTPSLAGEKQLRTVLDAVRNAFSLCPADGMDGPEITIEVNPETVTQKKAEELKRLGFDRVSMGVQSLDDRVLSAMGRVHSAERARQAYRILRDAGFGNINLDLIFGAPMADAGNAACAQTLAVWQETLDEVLELKPEHLSFYSLQLEEPTPLYKDYRDGLVQLPSWEENRAMYHYAAKRVKEAGYDHYEVSNAALPGFECRHNLKYWTMQPYLGFGTSAHSFTGLLRGEADWSGKDSSAEGSAFGLDPESREDLIGDYVFTQLRLTEGTDSALYSRLFGTVFEEDFSIPLKKLIKDGFIEPSRKGFRLTSKGLDNTNNVIRELLEIL